MGWSYRLATIRGIDLKVHVTFGLIVLIAVANWSPLGGAGIAFGIGLMLLLFACVTLHEFGHAIAAQRFGVPVREVVLLPIGGVAFLGRDPRDPIQELVIAAAGPLVNVAIIAGLVPLLVLLGEPLTVGAALLAPEATTRLSIGEALRWLLGANVMLVLFNLIPAFPLDGGRILRGLLGLRTDWATATRQATAVGQILAVVMSLYGLLDGRLTLVVIAMLVFFASGATQAEERGRSVLAAERAGDACNRHAIVLTEYDRLSTVVRYLLTSYQPDFAVMRGPELLGVVTRGAVLAALAESNADAPAGRLAAACPRVDAAATLADVRAVLEEARAGVAAVYDRARFIGLVNRDDLREAELILSFWGVRRGAAPPA